MVADSDYVERDLAHLPEPLSAAQQVAIEEIVAGPRGECSGPFAVLLRTPELMTHLQRVGKHLRYESALDQRLVELVVLMVARRWDQEFEWAVHSPLAIRAGIVATDVEALARGDRPAGLDDAAAMVWELIDELHRTGQVCDATYSRAMAQLGEVKVIEAVVTAGYYGSLAMVMNTARTAPSPAPIALPPRAPRTDR